MHSKNLVQALRDLQGDLGREGVPFAVIGALAMFQHGYVRHTEDIDIVTTPGGLQVIHDKLIGRGLVPRAAGLRKKLRNTIHQVDVDVIQSGEHAGAADSPVVYPDPTSAAFGTEVDGVRYATLESLVTFKIGSGVWGRRPRDLADVIELVKANSLDEGWGERLQPELRAKFVELVEASRLERDIE